ncbi:hypothetical protein GIB67_021745 [Kingdonia uniflora]|uniref:Cyclin C-terminal domain-containing protein n=1 Tax=Kingdonia uniflora TaxID=39325 RepID=A0A7J7M9J9_9MAGN|nr:hypothetical protein GIB67_021745 [Kingdonia uniflora]
MSTKESTLKGEALVRTQFQEDPYGCLGSLHHKKLGRDPFHHSISYPNGCLELEGLFHHCGIDPYSEKTLVERDFELRSSLENAASDVSELFSKIERKYKIEDGNKILVQKFRSQLTLQLKVLHKTVAASAVQEEKQLKEMEEDMHSFVSTKIEECAVNEEKQLLAKVAELLASSSSRKKILRGKAWIMKLLAVACLSLAAKMEEIEVTLSVDLQKLKLLVLSTLKWRMRVVTPFTFIDYFFHKNNDDLPLPSSQISRLVELILRLTRGIEYLEFKPFEVAAAVSISVIRETNLDKYEPCFIKNVQKERVFKCLELIHELQRSVAVQYVPQNPIGVLDVSC